MNTFSKQKTRNTSRFLSGCTLKSAICVSWECLSGKCRPFASLPTWMYMKDLTVMVWDTGGQDAIRPLWQHFYEGTQGIIFVVDSSDEARMPLAAK
eukprot:5808200-Amphidinium_carterae.2